MRAKYVFEKFTQEDSDPIKDLGIGLTTWDNFKRGDILVCKKRVTLERHSSSTTFSITYNKGESLVIYDWYKNSKELKLYVIPFGKAVSQFVYRNIILARIDVMDSTRNIRTRNRWSTALLSADINKWKSSFRFMQRDEINEISKI